MKRNDTDFWTSKRKIVAIILSCVVLATLIIVISAIVIGATTM